MWIEWNKSKIRKESCEFNLQIYSSKSNKLNWKIANQTNSSTHSYGKFKKSVVEIGQICQDIWKKVVAQAKAFMRVDYSSKHGDHNYSLKRAFSVYFVKNISNHSSLVKTRIYEWLKTLDFRTFQVSWRGSCRHRFNSAGTVFAKIYYNRRFFSLL